MLRIKYGAAVVTILNDEDMNVFDDDLLDALDEMDDEEVDFEVEDEEFEDPLIEADPEEAEVPEDDA